MSKLVTPNRQACDTPLMVGKRRREEDNGEPIEQVNRVRLDGITTSSIETPNQKIIKNFKHQKEEEGTSQISEPTASILSEKLVSMPMDLSPAGADATLLNLNYPAEVAIDDALKNSENFHKPCLQPKQVLKENSEKTYLAAAVGVDRNDPFYPYKKLGQVRSTAPSDCGSTTSQVEISESMRKWNEMKQNGFVSTIQVKPPVPRPKRYQCRKKNDKDIKKMIDEMTNRELNNKHTSVAGPSQLLSGLNPGIIKHVRNSKQVNSIIKAMLQNEMPEKPPPHALKRGSQEAFNGALIPCCRNKEQYSDSDKFKHKFIHESCSNTSVFNSEYDDDNALRLELSYSVTIAPEDASKTTNADFSTNQEDITSLSVKAADVALQWLKLIQHDIITRQAAIQRSKNRVKNAIEMELPYLFSRDVNPKQQNETSIGHSFLTRCSQREIFGVHLTRWKAVFTKIELSLTEEENQLETWFRQVEELTSQCQEGLRFVNTNGFLPLDAMELRILKSKEAYEREFAVRAAAASIYSTCNMIMTAENAP